MSKDTYIKRSHGSKLMNSNEVDTITKAMIKYNMIPTHRKTKKEQEDYANMRRSMRNNKQPKTALFLQLCLALIKDKTTLNPELTENHSDFFVKIINSFPDMTTSEIIELMVQQKLDAEKLRQETSKELFETKQNLKESKAKCNKLREELRVSEKTRTEYFNQLSQYDSDCDDDKNEDIDYDHLAQLSEKDNKINELSTLLYERDDEIKKLKQIREQDEQIEAAEQSTIAPAVIDEDEPKEDPKISAREWDRRMREEHETNLAKNRARFK